MASKLYPICNYVAMWYDDTPSIRIEGVSDLSFFLKLKFWYTTDTPHICQPVQFMSIQFSSTWARLSTYLIAPLSSIQFHLPIVCFQYWFFPHNSITNFLYNFTLTNCNFLDSYVPICYLCSSTPFFKIGRHFFAISSLYLILMFKRCVFIFICNFFIVFKRYVFIFICNFFIVPRH